MCAKLSSPAGRSLERDAGGAESRASAAAVRVESGVAEILGADLRTPQSWRRWRAVSDSRKGRCGIREDSCTSATRRRTSSRACIRTGASKRCSRSAIPTEHTRFEGPPGDDRKRAARDHPGGRRRQVQGPRRQVRRQAVQQPERHHRRAGRSAVLHGSRRSTCRRATGRSCRTRAYSGSGTTVRSAC